MGRLPRHRITVDEYYRMAEDGRLRTRMPLRLDNYSEPEPDLALVVPREDFYEERHPTSADVFLLVEVNDSSTGRDRNPKISLYARHDVPEVWIIDVERNRLHFYRAPRDGNYTDISSTARPGVIALSAFPDTTVDLSNLLGS